MTSKNIKNSTWTSITCNNKNFEMMRNLQTEYKALLSKNSRTNMSQRTVVLHKSQTSKTNITKHDNLMPNQQQKP